MTNKKFWAVLAAMGLAFLALLGGGCGGSSGGGRVSASYRDQFVDAVGDVVDDLQAIAGSAMSNKKVITAVNDITMQYLVSSGDTTVRNRAIGRTFMAGDVTSQDITGNPAFDKAAFVKLWSNKHITVRNGTVETFEIGQTDFQLTITGSDDHVTKLTVTPTSSTGYWQAFSGLSSVFNALFGQEIANQFGETHRYLNIYLCVFFSKHQARV